MDLRPSSAVEDDDGPQGHYEGLELTVSKSDLVEAASDTIAQGNNNFKALRVRPADTHIPLD